ncbi:MAG TPA: hypothetical protein VN696_01005, partial [Pyrinomonadaceae bacterium]|nr:hypothetical protein [Pyrinomonadaceae bacterium]
MRLLIALCGVAIAINFMPIPKTTTAATPEYDIIIRNGRVVDGSGRAGYPADVAIKDDRIASIGNLRGAKAKRE